MDREPDQTDGHDGERGERTGHERSVVLGGTLAPARNKLTVWGKRDPLYTLGPSPV
jgi:hypothetical protein